MLRVMCFMNKIVLIKLGEIWLKGKNRDDFINRLILNVINITGIEKKNIKIGQGRVYLHNLSARRSYGAGGKSTTYNLKPIFGIHSFVESYKAKLNLEDAMVIAYEIVQKEIGNGSKTFKVDTTRAYKKFSAEGGSASGGEGTSGSPARGGHGASGGEKNSMDINNEIGAAILDKFDKQLAVDVKNPDFVLNIEVRESGIYLYSSNDEVEGPGGLPVGTGGKGLAMLSGGIDSPVAMRQIMKRGMRVDAVHFYSPPYTGEKAKQKVIDLCRQLAPWNAGEIKLFLINFAKIQVETKKAPQDIWTLLHRRLMVKLAQAVATKNNYDTLISGESLGQVASQTIQNISAVSHGINFPILRPLIGFDKQETIDIAKQIDTYRISILPHQDCCTVFAPRNPKTKVRKTEVAAMEEKFMNEELFSEALQTMESVNIK